MKTATETLRTEHEAILSMLDATERASGRILAGATVPIETLNGILEFFQVFADRCHHGKEEDVLFPALERKGLPREGGPVGVMLHEHTLGRGFIREMADASKAIAGGNNAAAAAWANAALRYSELLRAHIQKENNILFVMAERLLSGEEQMQLSEAFETIETEKIGAGTHERLHASMARIIGELRGARTAS